MKSRRDFLKTFLSLMAAGVAPPLGALATEHAGSHLRKSKSPGNQQPPYKVSPWTGDDFTLGHRFRDNDRTSGFPDKPEMKTDFVIVGGGIGGLTAAHELRDHDFVLLEQYDQLGGQSRGGSFRGIDYSYGPAYIGTIDGLYGKLYEQLGIAPEKLPAGDDAFFFAKRWHQGLTGKEKNVLYSSFKRLREELAGGIKLLPAEDSPAAMSSPDLERIDQTPFVSLLKGYSPEFISLLDSICRSNCCGTTSMLSAVAGYYVVQDLSTPNYCFRGGNPAIGRALVAKVRQAGTSRLKPGCFVWQIKLHEAGADVLYTDSHGEAHTIACKHVIVATPPMVAWRQFTNLSDKMRASLMPFKYGAYLVANFLLDRKIFHGAYDNWVGAPFGFADIIVAETPYEIAGKKQDASVLTVYRPWEPGTPGRGLLYQGDRDALSKAVHNQLAQLVDGLDQHLTEIVLTRWGHAMPVMTPGYYARLRKITASYDGPYSFAYGATQGFPSAEAAIRAGMFAAKRALTLPARISLVVP